MLTAAVKALDEAMRTPKMDSSAMAQLNQIMDSFNASVALQQDLARAREVGVVLIAQKACRLWRRLCTDKGGSPGEQRKVFSDSIEWMNGVGLVRYNAQTQYVQDTILTTDIASQLIYANILFSFQLRRRSDGWMIIDSIQPRIVRLAR